MGDPCSDLTCGSLGPPKSTAQTACRSDQQFVYMSTAHCKLSLSLWWGGKCPRDSPFPWGSGPTPNTWFTWPTRVFIPNCMLTGSAISLRLTIFLPYILPCDRTCPPKIAPYPWGIGPSPNTWFLGPTQVHNPNGISTGSAVTVGPMSPTDRQTDTQSMLHR